MEKNIWSREEKKNAEGKGGKYLKEGKHLVSRGVEKQRKSGKIVGHNRRRRTEKEKEENILGQENCRRTERSGGNRGL